MNISTATSIFKFVTIRSATDEVSSHPELEIQPTTDLVKSLIDIIASDKKQPEQIQLINQKLEAFIQSTGFFRSKAAVVELTGTPHYFNAGFTNSLDAKKVYETLYDNIVVRTLTKSTADEIFKLLAANIKTLHQQLNADRVSVEQIPELRIILPEGLVISFSPPKPIISPVVEKNPAPLLAQIQALTEQKQRLQETIAETLSQRAAEQKRIIEQQAQEERALLEQSNTAQIKQAKTAKKRTTKMQQASLNQAEIQPVPSPALDRLEAKYVELRGSELQINLQLTDLSHQAFQLFPRERYVRIGEQYVDVGNLRFTGSTTVEEDATVEGGVIIVHHGNCSLKFPFQVADLKVVEQLTVGYVPGEIAHINNTQQGELHEKITRRLKRVETFESLMTEDETSKETDTQSTEKFTLEKAASEIQSEETSINVNASASGKFGVVTTAVDAGYSNSKSSQNANSASESYAKEIVQRVVERASNKIRKERSLKTLEEFEETVKHVIDNTKSTGPKSYVYRWLTKLSRATLKNYGKRLIFQIDVTHPSHYYLSREQPALDIPKDPRLLDTFKVDNIDETNYLAWAELYHTKLENPPADSIRIGKSFCLAPVKDAFPWNDIKQEISIEDQYRPTYGYLDFCFSTGPDSYIQGFFGGKYFIVTPAVRMGPFPISFDSQTVNVPLSYRGHFDEYTLNVEIECVIKDGVKRNWQIKCYQDIIDAYENLKAEAENKMSEFRPALNPERKKELIKTELKKGALSKMFRCNPFWITDNYKVGKEYDPDCCNDTLNAEKVRFLETVFDWSNITYQLYPYLYADKDNWAELLNLSDDDPHFEAFLQASFATVRIPVHRDSLKETAAVNFIMNNSIANYEVVPASMKPLLDELEAPKFTIGLDGEVVPVPIEVVDLGIFPVPTDLVILECGVENGVKPIGFPQTGAELTQVSIPKQYSPAIIADRCAATPDLPDEVEL